MFKCAASSNQVAGFSGLLFALLTVFPNKRGSVPTFRALGKIQLVRQCKLWREVILDFSTRFLSPLRKHILLFFCILDLFSRYVNILTRLGQSGILRLYRTQSAVEEDAGSAPGQGDQAPVQLDPTCHLYFCFYSSHPLFITRSISFYRDPQYTTPIRIEPDTFPFSRHISPSFPSYHTSMHSSTDIKAKKKIEDLKNLFIVI